MESCCKRNGKIGRCDKIKLYVRLFLTYTALCFPIFIADRITKTIALSNFDTSYIINKFVYLQLTLNRGVSWGLFNYAHNTIFLIITSLVIIITMILMAYTGYRMYNGYAVFGESLVIIGSLSNIVDRLLYGNVIDFIVLHIGNWSFPVFNLADMAICVGVFIMFYQLFVKNQDLQ